MENKEQQVKLQDVVRHEGLVTERDIDTRFGLFTEDERIGTAQKGEARENADKKDWEGIGD